MPSAVTACKSSVSKTSNCKSNFMYSINQERGCKQWHSKSQTYEGTFFRGNFHGSGTYKWNNSKVYEGNFYSNTKEGYAILSMANNSIFEGLFINNRPFGPGIWTHSNGRQDAGFWVGHKIVRLSRPVDFIIPRLAPTVRAKIKLLQFRPLIPLLKKDEGKPRAALDDGDYNGIYFQFPHSVEVYDPRSFFFNKVVFDANYLANCNNALYCNENDLVDEIEDNNFDEYAESDIYANRRSRLTTGQCLCCDDFLMMNYTDDESDSCKEDKLYENEIGILNYYMQYKNFDGIENKLLKTKSHDFGYDEDSTIIEIKGDENDEPLPPNLVSWNSSELCIEILKQIYRFRAFEENLNFKISELMSGMRTAFRKTGEKEMECLQFLKMCSLGPPSVIKEFLCSFEISHELMDSRGNNSLMFAVAADQHEVIEILLNYGVDVNTFNDENLTPLNLCLLRRLAQSNGIFNWEIAFLNDDFDGNLKLEGSQDEKSMQSIDRIFGDGMSVNDSQRLHSIESPVVFKQMLKREKTIEKNNSFESLDHITILNFKKATKDNSKEFNLQETSLLPGDTSETPDLKIHFIPESCKAEEFVKSLMKSNTDRYLFDLRPKKLLNVENGKGYKEEKVKAVQTEEIDEKKNSDPDLLEKLNKIDKTIAKLLSRGADPNLSEVPKPSIHLAVFTKEINLVDIFLQYGADPNRTLHPNEGCLTPLHVLVLMEPQHECIAICQLLLNFGADPERETLPEFSISQDEKGFLSELQGRTPLHLLCMRPDLERIDSHGDIVRLGILLATISNKSHFYKGHSPITLAMLTKNIRLLKNLLELGIYDVNQALGEQLGTPLYVLVSTLLQKNTSYENSIKMCDLLLAAGADPFIKLVSSSREFDSCIDYGYWQIDLEKAVRKINSSDKRGKSPLKLEKDSSKDYLKDHVKVIEYLKKKMEGRQSAASKFMVMKESEEGRKIFEDSNLIKETKKTQKKESKDSESEQKLITSKKLSKNEKAESLARAITDESRIHPGDATAVTGSILEFEKSNINEDEKTKKSEVQKKTEKRNKQKEEKLASQRRDKLNIKKDKKIKNEKMHDLKDLKRGELYENMIKAKSKMTSKTISDKNSIRFPNSLLQSLMEIFGNCVNIDVNHFLLPYIVLRDGNLYYKFRGPKTLIQEQYSLV